MPYVRITIHLRDGSTRSGARKFPEPTKLEDIRMHSFHLAADALGRDAIHDVTVIELPADDPAVVALILGKQKKHPNIPRSDGTHPYVRQQQRKPPR
jgi:hypothetical protein